MCALLVGLPGVVVVGVGEWPRWLRINVTSTRSRPTCTGCGGVVHDHGRRDVELVDLPVFGRPARLVWAKQRWRCPNRACPVATWTEQNPQIASTRCALTTRAARWATRQVGCPGRTVAEVARELGCDWHTVMDAVVVYGTPLTTTPTVTAPSARSGWTRPSTCRNNPHATDAKHSTPHIA